MTDMTEVDELMSGNEILELEIASLLLENEGLRAQIDRLPTMPEGVRESLKCVFESVPSYFRGGKYADAKDWFTNLEASHD